VPAPGRCDIFPAVEPILALTAFKATFGIVIVFFVVFPILGQGLIGFALAQVAGERAANERYRAGDAGESQG
jgi:hypothetical protein